MKNFIFLAIFFTSVFGFSQNREKGNIELTPILGYATANYYSSEELNNSGLTSIDFGINADYFFNDRWSLRTGLLNQTMGSVYSAFNGIQTIKYEEQLEYLTVPINANWHFGSTRKWNLNFGPSLGFLMSAKANGQDVKEAVNTFQLGLNFGIGYKIAITEKFSILLDYQGMTGLTEVVKDAPFDIKNAYGVLNIGGVFKL